MTRPTRREIVGRRWAIGVRWQPAARWMAILFASSSTVVNRPTFVNAVGGALADPASRGLRAEFWISHGLFVVKCNQITEFALLILLVRRALNGVAGRRAILGGVAFAASDEYHQTRVPARGAPGPMWWSTCPASSSPRR